MTIRVLIVDDEPLARRALRQLLARHDDIEVVAECADAIDAAERLRQVSADLVLLDIRMPTISGLDLARDLGARQLVVFVTAHEEHGVAAFETGAADYLLKPVTARRMAATLDRVRTRLTEADAAARLRRQAGRGEPTLERLVARVGVRDVVVPIDEVELLAAEDVYVAVHAKGHRYLLRTTLDRLAATLDPARFARVHRSFIVPLKEVIAVRHGGRGTATIELRNGAAIPVSRRRRALLRSLESAAIRG